MKAPRQWIKTWLKEDIRDLISLTAFTQYTTILEKSDIPFKYTVWLMSRPELKGYKQIDSVDCFYGMLPES